MRTFVFTLAVMLLCTQVLDANPMPSSAGNSYETKTQSISDGQVTTTTIRSTSSSSQTDGSTVIESSSSFGDKNDLGGKIIDPNEFNIDDYDFDFNFETETKHENNCESVKKILEEDNDYLLEQLQKSRKFINTLTAENSLLLAQLDESRSENEKFSKRYEIISSEIQVYTKKYQKINEDYGKIQSQYNVARNDIQTCKSKYELNLVTLKEIQESNIKLESSFKESKSTIATLQTTMEQVKTNNKNCGVESDEWKYKYESERNKVVSIETTLKLLKNDNDDFKKKVSILTEDLNSCEKESHEESLEIYALKSTVDKYEKEVSTFKLNYEQCSDLLNKSLVNFKEDELRDLQELEARNKIELELGEYRSRYEVIEKNYESERILVLNCKNDIARLRKDFTLASQKCDDDISKLHITFQGSLDKCEASLRTERDTYASEIKNLKIRINEIELELSVSIKNVEEAKNNNRLCQDEAISFKQTIESLKTTVNETMVQLTTCSKQSANKQEELADCRSSLDACTANRHEIESNFTIEITSLKEDKRKCDAEVATLRCDLSKFLNERKSSDNKVYQNALELVSLYENSKTATEKFVVTNDITCGEDCEVNVVADSLTCEKNLALTLIENNNLKSRINEMVNKLQTCSDTQDDHQQCQQESIKLQEIIDKLKITLSQTVTQIQAEKQKCEAELTSLRCDINKYFTGTQLVMQHFLNAHNVDCENCGPEVTISGN